MIRRDLWSICPCGCGRFFPQFTVKTQPSPREVYDPVKCRYRVNVAMANYGCEPPIEWVECDVCGIDIPIWKHTRARLQSEHHHCDDPVCRKALCGTFGGKRRNKTEPLVMSGESSVRFTYCQQSGAYGRGCTDYNNCLGDDGTFARGRQRLTESGRTCHRCG